MARLFQSLVICGAGLTLLDCGGRSVSHAGEDDATSGAGGSSASPGGNTSSTSGSPTSSATGGASAQAGTASSSGGLNLGGIDTGGSGVAAAGTAFGGATVDIPTGAESQWVCDEANVQGCIDVPVGRPMLGFYITTPCRTDTSRPQSPADCDPGTLFTCVTGNYAEKLVLFNCVCMKGEPDSCACPSLRSGCSGVDYRAPLCDSEQALCGCAYTCILK